MTHGWRRSWSARWRWLSAGLAAVLVVALIAAGGARLVTGQEGPSADADIRIIHGSLDAGPVDVYLDDELLLADVTFPEVSDPISVPAGRYQLQVVPAGEDFALAIIDEDVEFDAGASYLVAALGFVDTIETRIWAVATPAGIATGNALVRAIHGSPDAGPVDVALAGGETLFTTLDFPDASRYLDVEAGTYDLEVRAAGTTLVALPVPGLTFVAGTIYDLVIVGSVADGSLQALVVLTAPTAPPVASYPAHIYTGNCASLGEIVVPLNDVTVPAGIAVGQADLATQAATSFTTVNIPFAQILAGDHAINVHRSAEEIGTSIACGEIGGVLAADGSLAIGLRELDGSGFAGIAHLRPSAISPDQTELSLFLAQGLFASPTEEPAATPAPAPTEAPPATPTAEPTEEPTVEPTPTEEPDGTPVAVAG